VRLEYQADGLGHCVGENELRRMVADHLGHDPFRPDADRRVAIDISKTDAGFQGRIVWTEADGRRVGERLLSSRSRDCHEIAANVAFAVALQLQLVERAAPDEAAGAAAETRTPAPRTDHEVIPAPAVPERARLPAEVPTAPVPASPARLRLAVGAGPAVGFGMAPDPTPFGRLFVTARVERFSAELAADAALPVTQREPDGTGTIVGPIGASAAACAHVSFAAACLLGRLGWIRAQGTGVALSSTSWGRFGEVGIRLAGSRVFGGWTVSAHADALVMLSRWNVVLNDAVVWTTPRIGAVLGVDLALRFF
jgi:hypothetical protein